MEHEIPILDTAKFAAIVGIGPKFGYNSVQPLGWTWHGMADAGDVGDVGDVLDVLDVRWGSSVNSSVKFLGNSTTGGPRI